MKTSEEEMKVTPHFVAYLDILGYKNEIKNNNQNILLNNINKAISSIEESIADVSKMIDGVNITKGLLEKNINGRIFSDNIIIYISIRNSNDTIEKLIPLLAIITACFRIQRNCILQHGLLMRGAIVQGDFYQNDRFVFGKSLIDAYKIESEIAIYPRIIIDNPCFDILNIIKNGPNKVRDTKETLLGINEIAFQLKENQNTLPLELQQRLLKLYTESLDVFKDDKQYGLIKQFFNPIIDLLRKEQDITGKILIELNSALDTRLSQLPYPLGDELHNFMEMLLFVDNDGMTVLKYISKLDCNDIIYKENIQMHKGVILKKIDEAKKGDYKIMQKLLWVKNYHNQICDSENFPDLKI
ncbi:MAG: hypothetical protein ACIAQZ_07445 [Sedimentisphaeraceae bacterium JB056]